MVRQALFNILGPPDDGMLVLDLFAGTGALGIEALSRGAPWAVFIEHAAAPAQALGRNLHALGLQSRAEVLRLPVVRALPQLLRRGAAFTWIFADPPYDQGLDTYVLDQLGGPAAALLAQGALVIVEHAVHTGGKRPGRTAPTPGDHHGLLGRVDQRCYGQTALSFYAPTSDPSGQKATT